MNITLTVRGTLEEDEALQEIVSILYRKTNPGEPPSIEVGPEPSEEPAPKVAAPAVAAAPAAAEVDREMVRKAASDAINRGKRVEVVQVFEAHGARSLAKIAVEDYPAVLDEIRGL